MSFEISMAVVMVISAALAMIHAFTTRQRRHALFLLLTAVGFGYCFPFVDVNVFGHYGFDGHLTVFTLPFHLGFSWWAFYYLGLCLGERVLGRDAHPVKLAVVAGLFFGLLEYQWDLTLLGVGLMQLHVPSFRAWEFGFHPGVPMFHAMLGFMWVIGFHALRDSRRPVLAVVLAWASLVIIPLGVMASVALTIPMFDALGPRMSPFWQGVADVFHFATSFGPIGALAGLWYRWLGRRLGGAWSRLGTAEGVA